MFRRTWPRLYPPLCCQLGTAPASSVILRDIWWGLRHTFDPQAPVSAAPNPLSSSGMQPYNKAASGSGPTPAGPPLSWEFSFWKQQCQVFLGASGSTSTDEAGPWPRWLLPWHCHMGEASPRSSSRSWVWNNPQPRHQKGSLDPNPAKLEDQESGMFSPLCFSGFRKIDKSNLEGWRESYQLKRTQGNLSCFAGSFVYFLCSHPDSPHWAHFPSL